jgi:hypothetical protein
VRLVGAGKPIGRSPVTVPQREDDSPAGGQHLRQARSCRAHAAGPQDATRGARPRRAADPGQAGRPCRRGCRARPLANRRLTGRQARSGGRSGVGRRERDLVHTGFDKDLGWIRIPVTGDHGWPEQRRGSVPSSPGLYFVGLPFLHSLSSMLVAGVGRDAQRVADHIATRESRRRKERAVV